MKKTLTLFVTMFAATALASIYTGTFIGPLQGTSTNANHATNADNAMSAAQGGELISSHSLNGQHWAAMDKPWFFIYGGIGTNVNQARDLFVINYIITNGWLTIITNLGYQPCLALDANFMGGVRNTNLLYIKRNWGTLTEATNRFPNGLPWLISVCHSNNIKVCGQIYTCTNLVPAGASEFIDSELSGLLQIFTNGVGTLPSDLYGNYFTVITPDYMQGDLQELLLWGFDAIVQSDGTWDLAIHRQMGYEFGKAMLQTALPNGFKYDRFPITYQTINTNIADGAACSYTDITLPGFLPPVKTTFVLGRDKPAVYIAYETVVDQSYTEGYMTRANHTGVFYDNTGQGGGPGALRILMRDFPGQKKSNEGGYIVWQWLATDQSLMVQAITHGLTYGTPVGDNTGMAMDFGTQVIPALTNTTGFSRIQLDREQNWPVLLSDYGTNTTGIGGCVAGTKLFDGSWGIGIFNQGSVTTNFTVTCAQLGWPTNLYFKVTDAYFGYIAGSTNQGSYTMSLTGPNARMYIFEPLPNRGDGSGLTGILSTGISTNGMFFTSSNKWTGYLLPRGSINGTNLFEMLVSTNGLP